MSDALHASLTQRFVDKRTTALIRRIGADAGVLPVTVGAEGEVLVEEHPIGRLDGFRFHVAADARAADKRMLLAAAEKHLAGERTARAAALAGANDAAFALGDDGRVRWQGHCVAQLARGRSPGRPRLLYDAGLDSLPAPERQRVVERTERWLTAQLARHLPVLAALAAIARDAAATPALRVVAAALEAAGGLAERLALRDAVEALGPDERRRLRRAGVTIGALDLFDPRLLRPEAARWRRAVLALAGQAQGSAPAGATVLPRAAAVAGFRPLGTQAVRIDLVERIARAAHDARAGRAPFRPDPALATSMGMEAGTLARLMVELGFRPIDGDQPGWAWRGRPRARPEPASPPKGAFAALAGLVGP